MKNCKFCNAELEENSTVCPSCGKENAEEVETVREEIPAETAVQESAPADWPFA
jgi:predicted amidophosphoribosyltransferase